jgi:hypothetical protein
VVFAEVIFTEWLIMPGWVFTTYYMKEVPHYPYTLLLPTAYLGIGFPSESEYLLAEIHNHAV